YGAALERHHASGPPADWGKTYVSAYASAHPWEDWAETWAHYLHIVSSLDTAEAQGLEPRASGMTFGAAWPYTPSDIYREGSVDELLERWFPLVRALNELSRSMGHQDFYPFVLPAAARDKLAFVHSAIRTAVAQPLDADASHTA
ncbi:MAG: putative zinc-binding metallopeptidase, partial [Hyphomicrobiaceae bacterium]